IPVFTRPMEGGGMTKEAQMTSLASEHDTQRALRRIQKLSLHLLQPSPFLDPESSGDKNWIVPSPCTGGRGRPLLSVSRAELVEYMKGRHREIQERIFNFFVSRPELQTPVEISTADHRVLCMRQLTALVREAGIRPFRYAIEDPSVYFAIVEAVGGIDISLGIKLGVQYR
ncbi:acyl-coenzyme A oxidase, peroxisomal-like, partial [Phalaenopsis equestris]|uniref:acyl-coenzyme A oxidase, peroxisomal-like n=1 Tax=Phalaenopsis equestris TaxID=78828 RepID=UPI0009E5364D